MLNRTAILIFSRLPQEEVLFKKLSRKTATDFKVWQHLYERTYTAAAKTDLPIITCSEKEQVGENFAEKITNSIASAFEGGYQKLIVLGADCAQLTPQHIARANEDLQRGNAIVAGRDMRGGIYLLGIDNDAFDKSSFLNFSWQTNRLFTDIASYAAELSFSIQPSMLKDINNTNDISAFIHSVAIRSSFRLLLNNLLNTIAARLHVFTESISTSLFASHSILRGPPALL